MGLHAMINTIHTVLPSKTMMMTMVVNMLGFAGLVLRQLGPLLRSLAVFSCHPKNDILRSVLACLKSSVI